MSNGSAPAESPVFVDRSGTRRRWFVGLGVAGGGLLAVAVLVLVAGFLGGGPGRLPGLPGLPAPAGPAARQAEVGPSAPSSAARTPRSAAVPSHGTAPARTPSPTPAPPPVTTSPSPTPIRHGNAPPHPSHKK